MRAWRSPWVWTFATLLCASSDVVGEDGAFEEEWKAGLPAALEGAAAVAAWSHDANLFAERDRLAAAIVRLDRDHAKARAWLRHRRNAAGIWEPDRGAQPGRDMNAAARRSLPDHRRKKMGNALDSLWETFDRHREDLSPLERNRAAALLFDLAPEDERFAAATDRVRRGDTWIVREALESPARRKALLSKAAAVRQAFRGRVEPSGVTHEAGSLGHAWTIALRAGDVRLVTDGGEGEARAIVAACGAVTAFYRDVVDPDVRVPDDLTVLLVTDGRAWGPVVDRIRVPQRERERLKRYGGVWIPGTDHVLERGVDPQHRLDGSVRQVLTRAFESALPESGSAWFEDGLGLYLGWLLLGSRYSYFVAASRYEDDTGIPEDRLADSGADWFAFARDLLDRGRLPPVSVVSGLTLDGLRREDSLASHAFAAWLLEGHPSKARDFLATFGKGGFAKALEDVFGYDVDLLDARLAAWLRAVAAPSR